MFEIAFLNAASEVGSIFSRLREYGFQFSQGVVCAKERGRTKRLEIEPTSEVDNAVSPSSSFSIHHLFVYLFVYVPIK